MMISTWMVMMVEFPGSTMIPRLRDTSSGNHFLLHQVPIRARSPRMVPPVPLPVDRRRRGSYPSISARFDGLTASRHPIGTQRDDTSKRSCLSYGNVMGRCCQALADDAAEGTSIVGGWEGTSDTLSDEEEEDAVQALEIDCRGLGHHVTP